MYFNKYPYRANFAFAETFEPISGELMANGKSFQVELSAYAGDVFHVRIANAKLWGRNRCLETLEHGEATKSKKLKLGKGFSLELGTILKSAPGAAFGICGEASIFQFEVPEGSQFFGMGAKNFGIIELSGQRTKFWNTDVWGDFHSAHWSQHPVDPPYFSTPYVAAQMGGEWIGFLLHNPYPTFVETPGTDESRVFVEWQRTAKTLVLGSEGGEPNLWIIRGPTLPELTRKLQKLVGVTPTPPLWSLGYHQSRYGYEGHEDLIALDAEFVKHQIPCDSVWLDLDYMDGYRVFQTSPKAFPEGTHTTAEKLRENGRRIVPILDPGVKFEPGYAVYDDGHAKDVFCHNAEGREFVGLVWPGETVFPDFTLPKTRDWWAGYVKKFAREGFGATWIDMNDPSTGPVDPLGMLFDKGKDPHTAHHNQYALGMQMATKAGLLKANPNERPFVLSRSGFVGGSKHAAIWTGDNVSNYFYLRLSIPTTLGLSLSGQPFNGPDMGGFGEDADERLVVDWFKAGFLFPFFRNHSMKDTRRQEPFAYPISTLAILRRYIRLRYKLLPYLYNLFVNQEENGDPILRPLVYSFSGEHLAHISDEFMIGEQILQAPFVEDAKSRTVHLPGVEPWFEATSGKWIEPGDHTVKNRRTDTPLYLRAGAIVPMQQGTPTDNRVDLRTVHLHVFVPPSWSGESEITYVADDGISFDYRNGNRSKLHMLVVAVDGNLAISTSMLSDGFGPIEATIVIHGEPKSVRLNGADARLEKAELTLTGKSLSAQIVRPE